jgi:NADPH:quinone reductase
LRSCQERPAKAVRSRTAAFFHFTTTFVRSYAHELEKLDRLRQQVEAGKITLRVAEVYRPEKAADAHRRLEAGGTRGRLVIQF